MGTISVTLPSDGTTADVADVNTPINTIVNLVNGNLDNANIKSGAAIDPAKLSGGSTSMLSAWTTWSPTWTGLTVGNGTVTAKYVQIGKTVHFRVYFSAGSTSAATTTLEISAPVTFHADYTTSLRTPIGHIEYEDSGVSSYPGVAIINGTSGKIQLLHYKVDGTLANWTALNPTGSLSTGDQIHVTGTYEAA